MKITKNDLLDMARQAVADRGLNYGKPEDNFNAIARLWNAYQTNKFGAKENLLQADDVAVMMALMKLARIGHQPDHLDSWVDLAGYAACGANICCEAPDTKIDGAHERKVWWKDGVEYEWHGKTLGWIASGNHSEGLTNTPRRGEPLGSRDYAKA